MTWINTFGTQGGKNSLPNRIVNHLSRSFIKPGKRTVKKCIR